MDIGGSTRAGGSDRKRRHWPIHTKHILYLKIQPRQQAHNNAVRQIVMLSKETKDAIIENDAKKVLEVLEGQDVNSVSRPKCDSALHLAAESNADKSVAALIGIGANVNLQDFNGRTPLHYAVMANAAKAVSVLINDGLAIVDFPEQGTMGHCGPRSSGDTPLHVACRCGSVQSVEALLAGGANPNVRNNDLRTPLVATFHPVKGKSSLSKAVEVVRLLLKYGGDPEIPSGHEYDRMDKDEKLNPDDVGDPVKPVGGFRVPLHYAAHENSTEICKMLIQAGASGSQRDFFWRKANQLCQTWFGMSSTTN
mmetsp:Transcript_52263/g.72490  ORF Transcript_52263/g.72490 Transcript_52263/m.72490 type:complete len:309 (-) Transcript_52263:147-1073(-)